MREWKKPEILDLSFRQTKGNPGTSGNDNYIPDCLEFFSDFVIPTGPSQFTPSGMCYIKRDTGSWPTK